MEVEHQHRRRESENAVAKPFNATDVVAGEAIVMRLHNATIAADEAEGQPTGAVPCALRSAMRRAISPRKSAIPSPLSAHVNSACGNAATGFRRPSRGAPTRAL